MKTKEWNPNCRCGGLIKRISDSESAQRIIFGKRQRVLISRGQCDTCKQQYELIYPLLNDMADSFNSLTPNETSV